MAREVKIVGLDLSLSATGVACAECCEVMKPNADHGPARLNEILTGLTVRHRVVDADVVVLEGYSYAAANQAHQMGELGGVVRHHLWRLGVPYVTVAPTRLKKFATGKGNVGKDAMVAAAVRLGCPAEDNNAVDAWFLRQIGLYHYSPDAGLPRTDYRDETCGKIEWPVMTNE